MAEPTEPEARSIESAFDALEGICAAMSDEQLLELHMIRAEIFKYLRDGGHTDSLNATALTVREVYNGILKKREVGADDNWFQKNSVLSPSVEKAYIFGQKLVRWNRLLELRFWDRLLGRSGPLTKHPPDALCKDAQKALVNWLGRD